MPFLYKENEKPRKSSKEANVAESDLVYARKEKDRCHLKHSKERNPFHDARRNKPGGKEKQSEEHLSRSLEFEIDVELEDFFDDA